jgi:hypothetical protein
MKSELISGSMTRHTISTTSTFNTLNTIDLIIGKDTFKTQQLNLIKAFIVEKSLISMIICKHSCLFHYINDLMLFETVNSKPLIKFYLKA